MFSSGPSYNKLKTNLRLVINRLKLLEKKKTELALKSRKEIADYMAQGKAERAKIRVEHIIREDYLVEAMEIVEMFCDLLLARFGLIQQGSDFAYLLRGHFWVVIIRTAIFSISLILRVLSLSAVVWYARLHTERACLLP